MSSNKISCREEGIDAILVTQHPLFSTNALRDEPKRDWLTVELVLSGTVLSGHPVLSGWMSKSQIFPHNDCNFYFYQAATP